MTPSGRVFGAILLLVSALSLSVSATLRINDFESDITVGTTGEFAVTEQITAQFLTPHHGIERYIQVSGRTTLGETVKIVLHLDEVLMDGSAVQYTTRLQGGNRYIRIGDPNRTLTGVHTYTIHYRVERAFLFTDNSIRLYWNVTGNGWDIPIDQAVAIVRFPDSTDVSQVSSVSYVGQYGSAARGTTGSVAADGTLQFQAGPLYPGEGLTIVVSIPREMLPIEPPSFAQRVGWFLSANKYAGLPILTLIVMILLWAKVGRDPRKRVIAPAFEPPRGMHPGAAGVLIDDRIDLRDISAMLVGLAARGYLTIQESDDGQDYTFIRKKDADSDLSPAEETIFQELFDSPEREERTLSSLEQKFYKVLPTVKSRLYGQLISEGYYKANPERTRGLYVTIGLLAIPLAIYLAIYTSSLYLPLSVALCGLIVIAFARIMPRKTVAGVRKLEEILGLSEYIQRAEVDRIEFHDAPEKSPAVFEKLLPYAIAFNLTSIWTRQFEGLITEPPQWYVGGPHMSMFNALVFSRALTGMNRSMQQTFVSAPRSSGQSAWGGRGSFGGGFSGGGFGGGGGGGW